MSSDYAAKRNILPVEVRGRDVVIATCEPYMSIWQRDLIDELRAGGMRAVSPNGVLGDPHGATAAHGRSLLTRLTIDLVAAVDDWRV